MPNVQSAQVRAIAKPYSNFENSAWTLPALSPCAPSPQTLDTSGIKIVKEVVGGSFSDVFNFKYYKTNVNSGGTVSSSISLGQNSEHLFTNQPSGSNFLYKIEELPVSGYALTKIKCISNNSSWTLTAPLNARSVEFNYLDSTATITCTFTNTKTRGTSSVNIYNQLPDFASLNNLTQIQIPPSSPTPTSIGVTVVVEHDDYPPVLSGYSQPPANFSYTAYPDGVSFTLSKYPHGPQIFPPSKNIMPESLIKIVQSYSPTGLPAYMVAPDGLTAFPPYKLTGVSCASNGSATFTNDYASGILTGVNINGYSPNDSTVCTFTNSN